MGAGKGRKINDHQYYFSPKEQPYSCCSLYSSLWFFCIFFSISIFLRDINKFQLWFLTYSWKWPSFLSLSSFLLFTNKRSLGSFCAQHCTRCSDDLELVFNSENRLSLINQIGTLGALWSMNTCLNSSVTQIGCSISLTKKYFQKARVRCLPA